MTQETPRPRTLPLPVWGLTPTFCVAGVDLELWAHEHSYERLWPIYNYEVRRVEGGARGADVSVACVRCSPRCSLLQVFNGSLHQPYTRPRGPVHIITGSAVSWAGKEGQPLLLPSDS